MSVQYFSRHWRRMFGVIGLAAAAALMGGVGWATISQESVVYHGCYGPDGYVRIVQDGVSCKKNETSIDWNQQGPAGSARAYAAVSDYPWYASPVLMQTLNVESVVRGPVAGTYCLYVDPSLGDPRYLVPVVSPTGGYADPRYATTEVCAEDSSGRRAVQVNTFDSTGERINTGFHLVVP